MGEAWEQKDEKTIESCWTYSLKYLVWSKVLYLPLQVGCGKVSKGENFPERHTIAPDVTLVCALQCL